MSRICPVNVKPQIVWLFFKMNFWNIWVNVLMKLVENPRVSQPNQSQVVKVRSAQSFRDVFRTQEKILAFAYWIPNKAPS